MAYYRRDDMLSDFENPVIFHYSLKLTGFVVKAYFVLLPFIAVAAAPFLTKLFFEFCEKRTVYGLIAATVVLGVFNAFRFIKADSILEKTKNMYISGSLILMLPACALFLFDSNFAISVQSVTDAFHAGYWEFAKEIFSVLLTGLIIGVILSIWAVCVPGVLVGAGKAIAGFFRKLFKKDRDKVNG